MIKVLSNENMRKSDAYTIETKISSKELMYKAGLGVYNSINWHGKIAIVCGFGNNAGDGYVLALLLKEKKIDTTILLIEEKFSIDGKYYFDRCQNQNILTKLINDNTSFNEYDIIVDCIFGTGFKGSVSKDIQNIITKINESNKYVVSVDINSGLNGDTGLGDIYVQSDITISIGYYKTGHFLNKAKDAMKNKTNVDIGIEIKDSPYYLIESNDLKSLFPKRKNFSNKSTYGYIALIGGSTNYSGAIRLSSMASAAMRSGSGVVTLGIPKTLVEYIVPGILESTIFPLDEKDGHIKFNKEQLDAIITKNKAIGIGMGITNNEDTKMIVKYLLENYQGILVIDADGLNALSTIDEKYLLNTNAKVIITPHMMEFSRLTKKTIDELNENLVNNVIEYSKKYHLIALLKGPTTIVSDGSLTYLIDRGCSGMATAGSGDVLSGIVTSISCYNKDNLILAVAGSAYINGLAGELAEEEYGDISMIASDTVKFIPNIIKSIRN